MVNTFSKSGWLKDVQEALTTENENDKKILSKYNGYYSKVNEKSNLISRNDNWFHLIDFKYEEDEYYEKLLSFNYPILKLNSERLKRKKYARSITKLKGYVTEINDTYFCAKIYSTNNQGTYEIGEFDISDIDYGDLELLSIGGVFYWNFGHVVEYGQVKKMSEIRFQRISTLETSEFDLICEESDRLDENIDWE